MSDGHQRHPRHPYRSHGRGSRGSRGSRSAGPTSIREALRGGCHYSSGVGRPALARELAGARAARGAWTHLRTGCRLGSSRCWWRAVWAWPCSATPPAARPRRPPSALPTPQPRQAPPGLCCVPAHWAARGAHPPRRAGGVRWAARSARRPARPSPVGCLKHRSANISLVDASSVAITRNSGHGTWDVSKRPHNVSD